MRRLLDAFYTASLALGGSFLVLLGGLVLSQIVGRWFGLIVPGADEFAGFCMAATFFLALPHTLMVGGHIRVELVLDRLGEPWRRSLEIWGSLAATGIAGYFAWYAIELAWFSFSFGDMSFGLLPIPLWIPQSALAFGVVGLTIAGIDSLTRALHGKPNVTAEHRPSE